MFKPTLQSVTAKKTKALDVFHTAKIQLAAAVDEFKTVIGIAVEKKNALLDKVIIHERDIIAARNEIAAAESTISKINNIVGV